MKKLLYTLIVLSVALASFGATTKVAAADPVTIMEVGNPGIVAPGASICFFVTVKVNDGQLLESRGDMLRNTDGNLFEHWPHIAVVGIINTGQSYTFHCYGGMVAPTAEGTYESKWRVWRDGQYVGQEAVVRFEVKIGGGGGGGGGQPPVPPSYQANVHCKATAVSSYERTINGKLEHFIEFYIPEGDVQLTNTNGKITGATSDIGDLISLAWWSLYSIDEWDVQTHEQFKDDTGNGMVLPERHWRVVIPTRIVGTHNVPFLGEIAYHQNYRTMWQMHPEQMIYLRCKNNITPNAPDQLLPVVTGYSIGTPQPNTQRKIQIEIPDWMKWIQTKLRKGSNATITLIAPDGRVYSPTNSAVIYTDTPSFAVHTLNLDAPKGGTWQVVIDVISAENDSVFMLDVDGKQYNDSSNDNIPPVTGMHFDGTKGLNGWFVSDVVVTLSAEDNPGGSGIQGIEWSTDNGASWQPYTGPFTVGQEGLSYILGRSYDKQGNYEQSPIGKFLMVDKTPPVVTVFADQQEYTRVQPYIVHYSGYDPEPGSGLAALTAVFNNQPVTDGQTIDLFWLHLGQYTLTATAQDNAGWTTTSKVSWRLVATIESMKAALSRFCSEGYITNGGICNSLQQKLDAAKAARDRGQYKTAVNILGAFNAEVSAQENKKIPANVAQLLHEDANFVIDALKALP